jgi:hypothetical protein
MGGLLELQLLAALAAGPAPAHVIAWRLWRRHADAGLHAALRRLEERGCVLRLRDRAYRPTRRGLAFLKGELELARLLAATR